MNFNSLSYFLFLALCVMVYFALPPRWRNGFLLAAGYFFYMMWQPTYALLILTGTAVSYAGGRLLEVRAFNRKRLWLVLVLVINLGILFFFKYFNFSVHLTERILNLFQIQIQRPTLRLLLPVGISFYTFQVIGYTMDVYRGKVAAEKNFIDYALFVSFFPQLIAGPIERSSGLLPQFKQVHGFRLQGVFDGMTLCLWGLFKKMVIADSLAVAVNAAFDAPNGTYGGLTLAVAAVAFSIQIYCDFSAYSDIARGSARVLGFELMRNFDAPFMAASIKDFWRRWHISLSTWFKDYLYFPLGGNRNEKEWRRYFNLMVVFVVSGLWHGAALTFLVWGMLHGLYQITGAITKPMRQTLLSKLHIAETNPLLQAWRICFTFGLVTIAFVFFRAESITRALEILKTIVLHPLQGSIIHMGRPVMGAVVILFIVDAICRKIDLAKVISRKIALRYVVYFALLAMILIFGYYGAGFDPQDFIYFQF